MSGDSWFKPPLTVFIVWGGFVLCFLLCGSSKRLCNLLCCECDEEHADYDEETYENLSSRRRRELDNLRSIAILRKLARFTLTLKKENMITMLPDGESQNCSEEEKQCEVSSDVGSNSNGDGDEEVAGQNSTLDIESDHSTSTIIPSEAGVDETAIEESEYTHVMVPLPSYNINGIRVKELVDCDADEEPRASLRHKLFSKKSKAKVEVQDKDVDVEEGKDLSEDEEDPKEGDEKSTEKRAVPIFCAVCLMEYSISERVCWASNHECTHIFHEDCILKWLISLGRKRSKRQSFPHHPNEKRLLDYDLACPCCRQPFISKSCVLAQEEEKEEETDV